MPKLKKRDLQLQLNTSQADLEKKTGLAGKVLKKTLFPELLNGIKAVKQDMINQIEAFSNFQECIETHGLRAAKKQYNFPAAKQTMKKSVSVKKTSTKTKKLS